MANDIIGKRFGHLTVICETEKPIHVKDQHKWFLCKCDCGNEKAISRSSIGFSVTSCGCMKNASKPRTHGFASHKTYDKLYHTWTSIKYRCNNPKCKDYKNYGGRGIKMCDEWANDFLTFRTWCLENGFASDLTIDRIDVNGNYEPSNCRWVTVAEQNRNKTTTKRKEKQHEPL